MADNMYSKLKADASLEEVIAAFSKETVGLSKKDEKDSFNYAAWPDIWNTVLKVYPAATYIVKTWPVYDEAGRVIGERFYTSDESVGAFVSTEVTIAGHTLGMQLPILNSRNLPMLKKNPYKITTKKGQIVVSPFMSSDVNKAIMRCLVKNLSMFGLGLYVYRDLEKPDYEDKGYEPVVDLGPAKTTKAKGQLLNKVSTPVTSSTVTAADPIEGKPEPMEKPEPMSLTEALNYVMPVGKKKGQSIGQIIEELKTADKVTDYFTRVVNNSSGETEAAASTILTAVLNEELVL